MNNKNKMTTITINEHCDTTFKYMTMLTINRIYTLRFIIHNCTKD